MKKNIFLLGMIARNLQIALVLAFGLVVMGCDDASKTPPPAPPPPPALTGTVSISGTAKVGETLTSDTSALGGTAGTISYIWKQGETATGSFTAISGATASTYILTAAEENKYIVVTVSRNGYSGSITSDPTAAIAAAGVDTRVLAVEPPTFETVIYGYTQPAAQAITINNNGTGAATISNVALSGTGASAFELDGSGSTVSAGDSNTTRTVQPKTGLAAGTYTATITVTYNGTGATAATAEVSITVNKLTLTATAEATDRTYNGSTTVDVTITPTNTVGSDVVTLTATGTIANADAGNGKPVTISGISEPSGAQAGNYNKPASIPNTTVNIAPLTGTAKVIYTWVNEHEIVTSASTATLSRGADQSLTIMVTGSGYSGYQWTHNGSDVTTAAGSAVSYTFDSAGRSNGKYYIGLRVQKDNAWYSTIITITVTD
jgi:hypothetical protein